MARRERMLLSAPAVFLQKRMREEEDDRWGDASISEGASRWRSSGWLCLILLVLWLLAGGPREWVLGLAFSLAGLWLLIFPPAGRLPAWAWYAALAWGLASLLAFLPEQVGAMPAWRGSLEAAGLHLGGRITPQPVAALHAWASQFLTGLVFLAVLCIPDPTSSRRPVAAAVVVAVLVYLALSWAGVKAGFGAQDPGHFGFFPNRNHTATLLVMGAMVATGLLLQAGKRSEAGLLALSLVALVLLLPALVFSTISRAGVLLVAVGMPAVWLISGADYLRGRAAAIFALVCLAAVVVLVIPATHVKDRLVHKAGDLIGETNEGRPGRLDGRLEIFADTATMIRDQPWTGWGAGQFEPVFPQYRRLAANMDDFRNLHPESSWLWLAAESGIPGTLALAALAGGLLIAGVRACRKGPDKALRAGCVVAAAVPIFHSLVDVPLHRESLLWLTGLLLAVAAPFGGWQAVRSRPWLWRGAGAVVILGGAILLHGAWTQVPVSPVAKAEAALTEARRLYRLDQAEASKPGQEDAAEKTDYLTPALGVLEQAMPDQSLDARLHGLHGMLAIHFDEKDEQTRNDFLRQRLLAPGWVRLPLTQAEAWKNINAEETVRLWRLALERASKQSGVRGADPALEARIFGEIVQSATGNPALEDQCVAIAASDGALLETLLRFLPSRSLQRHEAGLKEAISRSDRTEALVAKLEGKLQQAPK